MITSSLGLSMDSGAARDMPCALLGDRASGKTTFLGLLYAAQVKYGTGVTDDFRFHAPIQSLNVMSAVYEGMKDGRFPSATLKEEITELGFVFGYLRKVVGRSEERRVGKECRSGWVRYQ